MKDNSLFDSVKEIYYKNVSPQFRKFIRIENVSKLYMCDLCHFSSIKMKLEKYLYSIIHIFYCKHHFLISIE